MDRTYVRGSLDSALVDDGLLAFYPEQLEEYEKVELMKLGTDTFVLIMKYVNALNTLSNKETINTVDKFRQIAARVTTLIAQSPTKLVGLDGMLTNVNNILNKPGIKDNDNLRGPIETLKTAIEVRKNSSVPFSPPISQNQPPFAA